MISESISYDSFDECQPYDKILIWAHDMHLFDCCDLLCLSSIDMASKRQQRTDKRETYTYQVKHTVLRIK